MGNDWLVERRKGFKEEGGGGRKKGGEERREVKGEGRSGTRRRAGDVVWTGDEREERREERRRGGGKAGGLGGKRSTRVHDVRSEIRRPGELMFDGRLNDNRSACCNHPNHGKSNTET